MSAHHPNARSAGRARRARYRLRAFVVVLAAVAGLAAAPASAQLTPADSAGVLLGIANRLRTEGRVALANSLLDVILERWGTTPAAEEARVLRGQLRTVVEERSGKTELLVFSTMYGLALGVLVPVALDSDSPEAYGLGLIAGGPAGYLAARQIVRARPVSEGQARAVSFGTLWGAWQGFGWATVLDLGGNEFCNEFGCFEDDPSGQTLARATLLGSLAGFGTGLYLARKEIPAGTATTVNFGAFWGTWYGAALNVLLGDDGDDDQGLTYALVGGDIGLVITALAAPRWQLSRSRARLISIAGVAGLLAGVGSILLLQPDGDEDLIAIPMLTSAAGLLLGTLWTRTYDERNAPRVGEPGSGALLEFDRGFRVGTPAAGLRLIEIDRTGRRVPALAVPLLRARF